MSRPADGARSDSAEVQRQLDRLAALSLPKGRLGLEPIRALMSALGHPHRAMPPVFHVAGTNGKGSTCAFLRAMLEAAGYRVHVYTSPHLVRFNERIRVAGELIEDARLAALLGEVLGAAEAQGLTVSFFEATTAAAFLAFARTRADACVIEVGLGGRLDATNVIERPLVTGIASLGIDHEAFLLSPEAGVPQEPLARIAFEKSGIAKPGTPLVTLDYAFPANEAIAATAQRIGARWLRRNRDWTLDPTPTGLRYDDRQGQLGLPRPALPGKHQAENAGLAVAMLRAQARLSVPESALAQGTQRVRWPARLQRLGEGPLTALLPQGTPVWLDGGHNPDAGTALALHFRPPERIHLVIGMLANKDSAALLGPLRERLASVTVVQVPGHESQEAAAFTRAAPLLDIRSAADVPTALTELMPGVGEGVLIAGSLYLAGDVLRQNGELPD
jgi:dihydrofolate synthase / folylpolyglutamate synthase